MPKQNLQSGIFELKIIEGKIEKISFGQDRTNDKMQKFMAFGNIESETLNIDEINQGIYQINRLRSNHATMKIEPGKADGESKIIIKNQKKFPLQATVGKDNLGNNFTGVQRTFFSANLDNLLCLNDNLNLGYTTNLHDDSKVKDIRSFTAGISIPFKSSTFFYDFYRSEFRGTTSGISGPLVTEGFSQQSKISLDHVLLNKAALRISAISSIAVKSAASYQNDAKIGTSERNLTILNLGFSLSSYFKNSSSLYLKPTYILGLSAFNATQNSSQTASSTPKAQFEAIKLYTSYSKKLAVKLPTSFTIEMDSQIAKQTLYGSEQFAIGGYYSVRGFRENYMSADSGYYFRNKVSFSPGYKLTFEPFYDYGYAKNKYDGSSGRMSGAGIKGIFASQYFNTSLTYGRALSRSNLISSSVKENHMIYFEISASCC